MIPVGYMAKRVITRPDWIKASRVADIYSVSNHVSDNFADYINYWKHNGYWFFDSPMIIQEMAQLTNGSRRSAATSGPASPIRTLAGLEPTRDRLFLPSRARGVLRRPNPRTQTASDNGNTGLDPLAEGPRVRFNERLSVRGPKPARRTNGAPCGRTNRHA
jgi:hypothetical protein